MNEVGNREPVPKNCIPKNPPNETVAGGTPGYEAGRQAPAGRAEGPRTEGGRGIVLQESSAW